MSDLIGGPWRSGRQDMVSYTLLEGEDAGPWKHIYGGEREDHPNMPGETVPIAVARAYGKTEEQALARARLIAAAPEMDELLKMARNQMTAFGEPWMTDLCRVFDALLARIDGKETP